MTLKEIAVATKGEDKFNHNAEHSFSNGPLKASDKDDLGIPHSGMDPDPKRVAGSFQKDAFKTHYHVIPGEQTSFQGGGVDLRIPRGLAGIYRTEGTFPNSNAQYNSRPARTVDPTDANDSETRPKNVAVYYYLRIY